MSECSGGSGLSRQWTLFPAVIGFHGISLDRSPEKTGPSGPAGPVVILSYGDMKARRPVTGESRPGSGELDGAERHRRRSRAGSPIRQAGTGSAIGDVRNGGMRDTPHGQPSRIQT
ncbi:protein of unknown function (plasmid) [Streptantibioticus cattleyicolor NRRL 8057 = DSM 46488]|nr:protein of unknown function [Streptantibioticus cattleyicolor NRRL 8057 = DSM 46488]